MRRPALLIAVLGLLVGTTWVALPAQAVPATGPTEVVAGQPGDVLGSEPSEFYLDPLKVLRAPADVQRIEYVSTGARGGPIAVSGMLLTPTAAWSGPGERPLVSYAVGTQGMADRCAPSRQLAAGTEYEGLFIKGLLARGYQVVVTDYEGLGTPGTHAYVNSGSLGRSVLDAARAAERLGASSPTAPVFIAGYSEGGNAAAGALEQHASYAPEVNIVAGYAGAVPADLTAVAPGLDGSPYAAFLLYSVKALADHYPELNIDELLNDAGRQALERADDTCTFDGVAEFAFASSSQYTADGQPVAGLLSRPDIAAVLEDLTLGRSAPDVPVLVAHSTLDDVVPYAQARDMARSWCRQGAEVTFAPSVVPSHVGGAVASYPKAFAFLESHVRGTPLPSTCGWF